MNVIDPIVGAEVPASPAQGHSRIDYRPLASFFGWTLIGWGLWVLAIQAMEAAHYAPPDPATVPKSALVLGFVARLYTSLLQHGMLVLQIGTLLYALFQALAIARDDAFIDTRAGPTPKADGWTARMIAACAGRPADFWSSLEDLSGPARTAAISDHLRFGSAAGMMPLRFALWAFPMFGFLGTVIGLSAAIGELSVIVSRSSGVSAETLEPVLVNLNVAFDTTIQGILSAVVVILLVAALDRAWERLDHRLKIAGQRFDDAAAPALVPEPNASP